MIDRETLEGILARARRRGATAVKVMDGDEWVDVPRALYRLEHPAENLIDEIEDFLLAHEGIRTETEDDDNDD